MNKQIFSNHKCLLHQIIFDVFNSYSIGTSMWPIKKERENEFQWRKLENKNQGEKA